MSGQHADADGLRLLVVGASSGIGHAVAVTAGERGAKVAVAARRMNLLTASMHELGAVPFAKFGFEFGDLGDNRP